MFKSFDFGKGLTKQIEAYKRLSPKAQQAKLPKMCAALQTYANNYMAAVLKPGKANPGQLTNGAEAMLDAAVVLNDDKVIYATFAELVARSKKVPVVPSLHVLVDRVLETRTEMNEERAALLSWRITTGSLGPERFLEYLAERARLTANRSDWKDYAWGLDQLIKNGTLKLTGELTLKHLRDLMANKHRLGDRAVEVQLKMVDSHLQRNNQELAEELLIEVAADSSQLSETFVEAVERLLQVKPKAEWGLHTMVLNPLLADYAKGRVVWAQVLEKLDRVKHDRESVVDFLLSHDLMPRDEKLSLHALNLILQTKDQERLHMLVERWTQRHIETDSPLPAEAVELIEKANAPLGPESKAVLADDAVQQVADDTAQQAADDTVQQVADDRTLQAADATARPGEASDLAESTSAPELEQRLAKRWQADSGPETAREVIEELLATGAEQWQTAFAHRWLGTRLLAQEDAEAAVAHLRQLAIEDAQTAAQLRGLILEAAGDTLAPSIRLLLGEIELHSGNYGAAFMHAERLDDDEPGRSQLLGALETWIVAQSEPPPQMLMALGQTQRLAQGDPAAGLEPATTASLLAPEDDAIQSIYSQWVTALDQVELHWQRAQQATFLCVGENRPELLSVAIAEIDALTSASGEELPNEPLEWLNKLRPSLDEYNRDDNSELRKQWTRLYLTYVASSGNEEAIPTAIQTAAEQVEPALALSLADELGVKVPAEARLMVECESLARQGEWERAVELINEVKGDGAGLLPVKLLCDYLPADALKPAVQQLQAIYASRGDDSGQLELIRCLDQRLEQEVGSSDAPEVRDLADKTLLELCQTQYEPAVRYLLSSGRQIGDPAEALRHMLVLVQAGDEEALTGMHAALLRLLPDGEPADLITKVAGLLAERWREAQPDQALGILGKAGMASGRTAEMLARIDSLGIAATTAENMLLVGQLALANGDERRACDLLAQLIDNGEHLEARVLADQITEVMPDSEEVEELQLKMQFSGESLNLRAATQSLLKLAQSRQERDQPLSEIVRELEKDIETALSAAPDSVEGLYLNLVVATFNGDRDLAIELIERIIKRGPHAIDGLLTMFENLAMEDAGLPSALVVTWGRILFMTGKPADALDRLAGLREAVGDYPEYTTLLKEIRDAGGGPDASMQLGEAYIRVNLWQRSAEEYAAALEQDPSLAIPILTQLRNHGSLDPNPMQYPLHLLALRCVAESDRQADWGWALSALTWLLPRWSAEELHGLAIELWRNSDQAELTTKQSSELLLHLFKLAIKLGLAEEALGYLHQAWALVDEPGEELLEALDDIDQSKLPADSPQWIELRGLELAAAVLRDDPLSIIEAAQKLAATGPGGRDQAFQVLSDYQRSAPDAGLVLLARLQLLDLGTTEGRQVFVDELLTATETDLPPSEVHSLISTVIELIKQTAESPELIKLLMQLFLQLGDEARAWQLALNFVDGGDELSGMALEVLTQLAEDEYALAQQIALLEVHVLRGEYEQAVALLANLDISKLGGLGSDAAQLAEAMLSTPAEAAAREWLVNYYREAAKEPLAADHVVWASATSNPLPADWLHRQSEVEMLFRSGQLRELEGDLASAKQQYLLASRDDSGDPVIRAAVCTRLSQLAEAEGDLRQAQEHGNRALEIMPTNELIQQRAARLATALDFQRIEELRATEDTIERTIEIARLLCTVGRPSEAINELQQGISRGQGGPEVLAELGDCFITQGDYRIALRVLADVTKRLEDVPAKIDLRLRALYSMATAYEHLQEHDESIYCLEQILVFRQDYRDSRDKLEELYARKKEAKPAADFAAGTAEGDARSKIVSEILDMLGVSQEIEEEGTKS